MGQPSLQSHGRGKKAVSWYFAGDVIIGVEDKKIMRAGDLVAALDDFDIDQTVSLTIMRGVGQQVCCLPRPYFPLFFKHRLHQAIWSFSSASLGTYLWVLMIARAFASP